MSIVVIYSNMHGGGGTKYNGLTYLTDAVIYSLMHAPFFHLSVNCCSWDVVVNILAS